MSSLLKEAVSEMPREKKVTIVQNIARNKSRLIWRYIKGPHPLAGEKTKRRKECKRREDAYGFESQISHYLAV